MKRNGDRSIRLVVFIYMSCNVVGQKPRLFCEEACSVGSTCAMLKVGNGDTRPGCINKIETEMLAKALRERSSRGHEVSAPASVNLQRVAETRTNVVHSHDTAQGIVTHRHEIPAQINVATNDSPRPLPQGSSNALPIDSAPTNTVSTRLNFNQPSLLFGEPVTFERFMSRRPLRIFYRGGFLPIQSHTLESIASTPLGQTDGGLRSRSGNSIIHGLSLVRSPMGNRPSIINFRTSTSNPNVIREALSSNRPQSNDRFAAFPIPDDCGRRCNSHLECLRGEFCGRSTPCRGAIVCQSMPLF